MHELQCSSSSEHSSNSSYSLHENKKCCSPSISEIFQNQHVLLSAGIGEGIAYWPVSILGACALVLNLLIGILWYDGKVRFRS